jgi:hypothetical protein
MTIRYHATLLCKIGEAIRKEATMVVKLATFALGLVVATTVSPSFAQTGGRTTANRAQAIQDCNAEAGKYSEHLWGNVGREIYRSCMAQRGQQE